MNNLPIPREYEVEKPVFKKIPERKEYKTKEMMENFPFLYSSKAKQGLP